MNLNEKITEWNDKNNEFLQFIQSYNIEKVKELMDLGFPVSDDVFIEKSGETIGDMLQDDINSMYHTTLTGMTDFLDGEHQDKNLYLNLLRQLISGSIKKNYMFFFNVLKYYIVKEENEMCLENLMKKLVKDITNDNQKVIDIQDKMTLEFCYELSLYNQKYENYLIISSLIKKILNIDKLNYKSLIFYYYEKFNINEKSWINEYEKNKLDHLSDDIITNNLFFMTLLEKHLQMYIDENEKEGIVNNNFHNLVDLIYQDYKKNQYINIKNIEYMAVDLYWTSFSKKIKELKLLEEAEQKNKTSKNFKIRMFKKHLMSYNKNIVLYVKKMMETQKPKDLQEWFRYINLGEQYYRELQYFLELDELLENKKDSSSSSKGKI